MFNFLKALVLVYLLSTTLSAFGQADIVVAIPNKVGTLNPIETVVAQDRFILPLIFEFLVEADPYGEINNRLITGWEFDKDSKILKMKIVKDRKFSDGTPLEPHHVVDAFKELCSPGSPAVSQFIGLEGCGSANDKLGVSLSNENAVQFKIGIHPNAFLYQLAYGRGPIFKTMPSGERIGTGPFKVKNCQHESCRITRNEFSTRESDLNTITFKYVKEDTLADAITKGSFDIAAMYLEPTIKTIPLGSFTYATHAENVTQVLVLNPLKPPFNDLKLRKSFRDLILNSELSKCKGLEPAYGWIPKGIPGSIEKKSASIIPVKTKIREANVTFFRHIGRKDACEERVIQDIGKALGLNIAFEFLSEYPALISKYQDPKTSGYVELNPFVTRDPSSILRRLSPNSKENYYFYSDPKTKSLIDQALQKPTMAERVKIYKEINTRVYENASIIPLYYISHTVLISSCFALKTINLGSYNPNSFLYLLDLQHQKSCKALAK